MIKIGKDIKLNVRPITIGLIHKYYYEGPCRFAAGDALKPEFDIILNAQQFEDNKIWFKENMPDFVNLMEHIYVERTDDWDKSDEIFEAMCQDSDQVDLYLVGSHIGRDDIIIELAQRTGKPIALDPANNFSRQQISAALTSRGFEAYMARSWTELNDMLKVLRVRKVLRETKVLLVTRFNSQASFSSSDNFLCLEMVTKKLGTKFRYLNIHEFMDQMTPAVPEGNHTTPGKITPDLNDDDMLEVKRLADELMSTASEVQVARQYLENSLIAYVTAKKNLDLWDCNAFTIPCPDMCSTRRVNQMKFTMCLTHSLLNEQGIPSGCEYDINAVLSMMALTTLSGKEPFQGNTAPIAIENGKPLVSSYIAAEDLKSIKPLNNLYFSQHSVPGRYFKGIDGPASAFALRHFAYDQKFGAIMRYDFKQDIGQTITLARFTPDCKKIFIGKGEIVGGGGYDLQNCNGYVVFRVPDQTDFYKKHKLAGNHLPWVYGDYTEKLVQLAELLELEVLRA